jgi:hypothetical protein
VIGPRAGAVFASSLVRTMPARIPVVSGVFLADQTILLFELRVQLLATGYGITPAQTALRCPSFFELLLTTAQTRLLSLQLGVSRPPSHYCSRPTLSLIYVSLLLSLASLWRAREASLSLLTCQTPVQSLGC